MLRLASEGRRCGQAENLIKLHKSQLASDRTSCRSALANQVRLVLHTAAYWLLLTVRDVISRPHPLATAEFMRLAWRVTKIAARVCVAFAAACPDAGFFRGIDIVPSRIDPSTRRHPKTNLTSR